MKVKNKHLKYLLLSILAIGLLSQSWYNIGVFPLAMLGFVPIFFLEHYIRTEQKNSKFWLFTYGFFVFLSWNIATCWWIWNASEGGAIAAFLINSLPMVLPLMLYSNLNSKTNKHNILFFTAAWLCLEWVQFYWDFAFPWLILGNAFANYTYFVQWYEYSGVLGGSALILLFSYYIFNFILTYKKNNTFKNYRLLFNIVFFGIFTPLFSSYYLVNDYKSKNIFYTGKSANMLVVQPNIDPYSEKFGGLSEDTQLQKMLALIEANITPKTQFIVLPETALQGGLNEGKLDEEYLINAIKRFLIKYPNVGVLTGADSYKIYQSNESHTATARSANDGAFFYDAFNSAFYITATDSVQIYHKNKLVPGVEKMPYPEVFKFLEEYSIGLGGTSGSLGSNNQSSNFETKHKITLAPIICYESVFSAFTTTYVANGADVLVVITNDGWWGDSPGYKQHLSFAKLRAIETRKFIARSANTGISAFINPYGEIVSQTQWWQPDAISQTVYTNNYQTFYTKHRDYFALIAFVIFMVNMFNLYYRK